MVIGLSGDDTPSPGPTIEEDLIDDDFNTQPSAHPNSSDAQTASAATDFNLLLRTGNLLNRNYYLEPQIQIIQPSPPDSHAGVVTGGQVNSSGGQNSTQQGPGGPPTAAARSISSNDDTGTLN